MINSPLLPFAYDNRIVEHLIGGVGGEQGRIIVLCSPWTYDNSIAEALIGGGGGGGRFVINSPLLPLAYDNRRVGPPIGG